MEKMQVICGELRVQVLSNTVIRIEKKGPEGFEDRTTFTVVDRNWQGGEFTELQKEGKLFIYGTHWTLALSLNAAEPADVVVLDKNGKEIAWENSGKFDFLPSPPQAPRCWVMPDTPRAVPPEWGCTPPPNPSIPNSGWDVTNDSPDFYLFLPGDGGYRQILSDFLKLTGPVPLPPLYAFGFMHSRYHPYSQEQALAVIDKYRNKKIPLDVFVLDTDWRVGSSHGYEINTELFPDMKGFLDKAHSRHVRVMFNDHPEPSTEDGLAPEEFQYRWNGLTSLLSMGMDLWWFDRNWKVHLNSPLSGMNPDVWGMRIYHDITERFNPDLRPLLMSNVSTIFNGRSKDAPHPIEHRYPIWWTGDTRADWNFLRRGIENAVDFGVLAAMPYLNEDLGGHAGKPSPELYCRFLQFGCLSPGARVHCTRSCIRDPWEYGDEAEKITCDYIKMRYRLLPHIYQAARKAYETGMPVLRRCDLYWPDYEEAHDSSQYLFGDDILVAPVNTGTDDWRLMDHSITSTRDNKPGWECTYYKGLDLEGDLRYQGTEPEVESEWYSRHVLDPLKTVYSARWIGRVTAPESGDYELKVVGDGGLRLFVNNNLVEDKWESVGEDKNIIRYSTHWEEGNTCGIKVEYRNKSRNGRCKLFFMPPSVRLNTWERSVWIPPGTWTDLWSGEDLQGPMVLKTTPELRRTPLFARRGAVVVTIPQTERTDAYPWTRLVVDAWVNAGDFHGERRVYEDDTETVAYKEGAYRQTPISFERNGDEVRLETGPVRGTFNGAPEKRDWIFRLHLPAGAFMREIQLNGEPASERVIEPSDNAAMPFSGSPEGVKGGRVIEVSALQIDADEILSLEGEISA